MTGAIGASMLRAAARVERAAAMADAAGAVELPTWFRRGAAIRSLEQQWAAAADEARRGVAELGRDGAVAPDAARAIAHLADRITPGARLRVDHALDVEDALRAPAALRQHAVMLRQHAALDGVDPATARATLQAELDDLVRRPVGELSAEQVRRIGELAWMPPQVRPAFPTPLHADTGAAALAFDHWPHSFAERGRPELEHLRLHQLRRELELDPTSSAAALDDELRTILTTDGDLAPEQAERLAVLARTSDELRPAILAAPRPYSARSLEQMLPTDWHRLQVDALRRAIEVERIVADPAMDRVTLTAELMSLLVRPDAALSRRDLVRMSAIGAVPESLRPPLRVVDGDVRFAPRNGTVNRPDGIGGAGLFPATRLELVRHDPELAADAVRRLVDAGEDVDGPVVIELGRSAALLRRAGIDDPTFERIAARVLADKRGPEARADIRALLLDVERRRMVADPTVTRAGLDAELRGILAMDDAHVTQDHLRRVALIAGMPDELRPALADTPVPWTDRRPLKDFAAWEPEPRQQGLGDDARGKLAGLRMGIEVEQAIADPTMDRRRVTQELVELLALPNDELTTTQLRRLSLLARMPEHLRPPLPDVGGAHFRLQDLGVLGFHPATDRPARAVFDTLRVHVAATVDPDAAARQLTSRIAAGEALDFRIVTALADQPGVLDRHGITPSMLSRAAVGALRSAGSGSVRALEPQLAMVRVGIEGMATTVPGSDGVKAQALALIDRNLDRLAGRLTDGMAGHPDYAELGRLMSLADLLHAFQPASKATAAAGTAAGAPTGLVW